MDDAAENRLLFREVNERIRDLLVAQGDGGSPEFLCECEGGCTTTIPLSLEDYERVRETAARYLVLPAHRGPEEQIVEEHDGWVVVDGPA